MQPDEQWEEPEPPQSGGLGRQWDEWEQEDAEDWEQGSTKSQIDSDQDERARFIASMRRAGFNFGCLVRIAGLRGSPEHNGKQGKIVDFDHQAVRLQVLLDQDHRTLSLKAFNLERLPTQTEVAHGHNDGVGRTLARGGVGLVLKVVGRNGKAVLMVKSITEGSPAQESGKILVGDCLVSVDGKSVDTIYKASEAILGEYGSEITMVLERMKEGVWIQYSLKLSRGKAAKLPNAQ